MHPCGNCQNQTSSFEAVRVDGFPFKYAVTDDEVGQCKLLKWISRIAQKCQRPYKLYNYVFDSNQQYMNK